MFLVSLGEFQATDIMTYDATVKRICIQIQRDYELEDKWQFLLLREITDHCTIKGANSRYEVLVNLEGGSVIWEPISVMRHYDPIYIANYVRYNNLLNKPV